MKILKNQKKYFLIVILAFLLQSCSKSKEESTKINKVVNDSLIADNVNSKRIKELRYYLLLEKRISTLLNLWYAYEEANQRTMILSDAFFMANIKNDPLACHLIFEGYCYLHFPEIEYFDNIDKGKYFFKLPKQEREIIIKYLEKGAEQKYFECVDDLIQIYEYENNPKLEYYKRIKDVKYIEDFY
jgi:hypothetical protein